ncbi:monocarboxylate transporter 12-like [Apostichopus japonicus]|uniref:monocarboxylate transporter 12-like n=1 Tax=Stichopus japonicus TaxID=307972 RepID=UPI003AB4B5E7
MTLPKLPSWTAAFCALFFVNVMSTGSMKVCGIFFDSMQTMDGLSGTMTGLIFVVPSAVSHLIAPIIGSLARYLSYRQLGIAGGSLVGGGFICSGLFSNHGLHFLGFSVISGLGFGFLFLPAVLCLREQAPDHFASLMPLATLGGYCGVVLLPIIIEVLLENYGLRGAFCLFGALSWNTIPCGLLLVNGKGKQYENLSNSVDKSEPSQEVEAVDKDSHNFTNLKYGLLTLMKYFRFFAIILKEHLSLFLDLTFTLFFITANTRRFPSDTWTLFLIPYNQELGMTKSNAVFISAVGGFGGIVGRFVAAASFKLTKIISPLTLFALCYCLNAIIFASFSLWNNPIFLTFCGFSSALLLSFLAGTTSGILLQLSSPETFRPAFGLLHFGCGIFSIFAGILSGKSYDVFGSFAVMFEVNALINAVSCVLVVVIIVLRKLNYKNTIQN